MEIRKHSYELYKLDWMASHGYTLQDVATELAMLTACCVPAKDLLSEFEQNGFFGGEIYSSFDEFIDNEYQDMDYMRSLLSKENFVLYLRDLDKENETATILHQKAEDEYAKYESYAKKHGSPYEQLIYAYIHLAIMNGDLDKHAPSLYTMDKPIEFLYEEIQCDSDLIYSCLVDYLNFRLEDMEVIE